MKVKQIIKDAAVGLTITGGLLGVAALGAVSGWWHNIYTMDVEAAELKTHLACSVVDFNTCHSLIVEQQVEARHWLDYGAESDQWQWSNVDDLILAEDGTFVNPSFYANEVEYDLTLIEGEDLYYELNDPKALMELYRYWYGEPEVEFGDDLIGNP